MDGGEGFSGAAGLEGGAATAPAMVRARIVMTLVSCMLIVCIFLEV